MKTSTTQLSALVLGILLCLGQLTLAQDEIEKVYFLTSPNCPPCKHMLDSTFPNPAVKTVMEYCEFQVLAQEDVMVAELFKTHSTGGFPLTVFLGEDDEILHQKVGLIRPNAFVKMWDQIETEQNLKSIQAKFDNGETDRKFLWQYLIAREHADLLTKADIREAWNRMQNSNERFEGENLVFAAEWMMLDYVHPVWNIIEEPVLSLTRNLEEARSLYTDSILDSRLAFYSLAQINSGLDSLSPNVLKPAYFLLESLQPDWLLLNYSDSGNIIAGVQLYFPAAYLAIEVADRLGDKEMQIKYEEQLFSEIKQDPEWLFEYLDVAVLQREVDSNFVRRCLQVWRQTMKDQSVNSSKFHLMTAELALKSKMTNLAASSLEQALQLSSTSDSSYAKIQALLGELKD